LVGVVVAFRCVGWPNCCHCRRHREETRAQRLAEGRWRSPSACGLVRACSGE
jgi:hypothetical protein